MRSLSITTLIVICLLIITPYFSFTQSVGINNDGSTPHNSAMLDIKSNSSGLLIPRLSTNQRTGIQSPATGLVVFDTNTKSFWFYSGSSWEEVLSGFTSLITDSDNDTKIEVEKTVDDDTIRITTSGIEYFKWQMVGYRH